MVSTAAKCRRRRRILDDAGKAFRQAERLAHPVDDPRFEFGGRRRGLPQHALRGHRRDQVFGDHRDGRRIGREIGEEARMLPVRHAGHDLLLEIGEDPLHRLRRFRRRRVDAAEDLAGSTCGRTGRSRSVVAVVGAPVGRRLRPVAEIVAVHASSPSPAEHQRTQMADLRLLRKIGQARKRRPSARSTSRPRWCGSM